MMMAFDDDEDDDSFVKNKFMISDLAFVLRLHILSAHSVAKFPLITAYLGAKFSTNHPNFKTNPGPCGRTRVLFPAKYYTIT